MTVGRTETKYATSAEKPLVSVGVPVHNGALTLQRALESIVAQDYPNLEIIISDNGSKDESYSICRAFAEKYSQIRVLRQPRNIGAVRNFRAVLAEARGEFFMWAAADDFWHREFISAMLGELDRHPDAIVAMCSVERVHPDGRSLDLISFGGADNPNHLVGFELLRRVFSPAKFNLFIYGLFRTTVLRTAMRSFPDVLGGDRQFIGLLALCGNFRYVERVLHIRTHQVAHQESYQKNAAGWRIKFRQQLTFLRMILSSPLVPNRRKLAIPLAAIMYAAFLARKPSMRTQLLLTLVALSITALAMALLVPHTGVSPWAASFASLVAAGLGTLCALWLIRRFVMVGYGMIIETLSQSRMMRIELRYMAELIAERKLPAPAADVNPLAAHVEARRQRTRDALNFVHTQAQSRLRQVHLRQVFPGVEAVELPVAAVDSRPGTLNAAEGLFLWAIVKLLQPGDTLIFDATGEMTTYLLAAGLQAKTTKIAAPDVEDSETADSGSAKRRAAPHHGCEVFPSASGVAGKFDLVVISGEHGYECSKADAEAAFRSVKAGGTIVWCGYTPRNAGLLKCILEITQQQPLFRVKEAGLVVYIDGINPMLAKLPEIPEGVLKRVHGKEATMLEDLYY